MKKVFFLFLTFSSVIIHSQIPDYFDNNPKWYVGDWELDEFGLDEYQNCIIIDGDSVVGSYTYKIFKIEVDCNPTPEPPIIGLYRQEGRKIYRYWYDTDSLFISYDLNIGDANVDHIDSILVGTEYRRIFLIDTATSDKMLIEGIGTRYGHLNCRGYWFELRYSSDGDPTWHGLELFTYSENGIVLYGTDACSAVGIDENESAQLSIYPVPANNFITIQSGEKEMQLVEILDVNGRIIMTENTSGRESMLDISFLENGIYFVRVTYQTGEYTVSRIVKQ